MKYLTVISDNDEVLISLVGEFILDYDVEQIWRNNFRVVLSNVIPAFNVQQKGCGGNDIVKINTGEVKNETFKK